MKKKITLAALLLLMTKHITAAVTALEAIALDKPDLSGRNAFYVANRPPLQPSPLIKLPIGTVKPRGWLRKHLQLQADGFHGHLGEISRFLRKENNAWLSPMGRGANGWEEEPYWLKGYSNCAYVLGDEKRIEEAKVWIEGMLSSQKPDGWFGPDEGRGGSATGLVGRDDLWPNMIALGCLQDYCDFSADERVIALMSAHFKYLQGVPDKKYLVGWARDRGGDMLHPIYWLYNRTGERSLLDLAAKTHRNTTAPPASSNGGSGFGLTTRSASG